MIYIHPTAVVYPGVKLAENVFIGPFAVVGQPQPQSLSGVQGGVESHAWLMRAKECLIGPGAVISSYVVIGDGSSIGNAVYLDSGTYIGHDTVIGNRVEMFHRAQVMNRVVIGDDAWVGGFVCNDARIGSRAVVYGRLIHKFVDATRGVPEAPPFVEEDAFVGEGTIVIGAVIVGRGAYVGAGSLVTKNVTPHRLFLGSPARDAGPARTPFKNARGREPLTPIVKEN